MQEIIQPLDDPKMTLMCGSRTVPWIVAIRVQLSLTEYDWGHHFPSLLAAGWMVADPAADRRAIHVTRAEWHSSKRNCDLLSHLYCYYPRQTSESKDKIYTLLDMSPDNPQHKIPVRYEEQGYDQTYIDIAKFLVRGSKDHKLLSVSQYLTAANREYYRITFMGSRLEHLDVFTAIHFYHRLGRRELTHVFGWDQTR